MSLPVVSEDLPFIVSTNVGKPDPGTRKLIRSRVMLGKNLGKTRTSKPRIPTTTSTSTAVPEKRAEESQEALLLRARSVIPERVGSELSLIRFADTVEISTVAPLFHFSTLAKRLMFPLEPCVQFDKKDISWIEPLTFDPVYLHAMVFMIQTYFEVFLRHKYRAPVPRGSPHFSKAIRLLRQRLASPNETRVSDTTVAVVLSLVTHAHIMGDNQTAKHHLAGLHRIVQLRGGTTTFAHNPKLLIEVFRCDIGLALHSGFAPFFTQDYLLGPLLPHPETISSTDLRTLGTPETRHEFLKEVNDELAGVWISLKNFCRQVNDAVECKRRLSQRTLLNNMACSMYRLLSMSFERGSVDETLRVALVAFSADIFLHGQQIRLPHAHSAAHYRGCLASLKPGALSLELMLWILMIGAISTFDESDNAWLKPWLRSNIIMCRLESWTEVQDNLKSLLWVEFIHDIPGKTIFDSIFPDDSFGLDKADKPRFAASQ